MKALGASLSSFSFLFSIIIILKKFLSNHIHVTDFPIVIILKKFISKSLHDTALTSSPEFLCPTVRRSRATAMAASWSTTCGSRIRDRNGGSSTADSVSCWLVMTKMADPLSCWHLMAVVVDRDRGGSSWWILVAALDSDCGLYWHPMVDHDRGGSWP